ncbi:MAG: hypothetical protein E7314_07345 [Clostridiales bacterium]|nr:hypothetical protein [Clostridiales bacterium]
MESIIENIDLELLQKNVKKISDLHSLIQNVLKKDYDYGIIPGTAKPTLLKPGAEKICMLFELTPKYEFLQNIEDYSNNFFSYSFKCSLYKNENVVSEGVGSCNSKEKRYRYLLVNNLSSNYSGESEKVQDKYGNIKYRIENIEIYNYINTILKMAKKRAFVDAILQVASLSEMFTQDIEDLTDLEADNNFKMNFGKYKGKTLEEIYKEDKSYLVWLKNNEKTDEKIKKACDNLLIEENAKDVNDGNKLYQ